jgi:hypothetical protein
VESSKKGYTVKNVNERSPAPAGILGCHGLKVGFVRPFELGGETRLIRSTVINWRPGKFVKFLMIQSHERNIKSFSAAEEFLGWRCPIKVTYRRFSVPGK